MPIHDDALDPSDPDWQILLDKVSPRLFHLIRLERVELAALVASEAAALHSFEDARDTAIRLDSPIGPSGRRESFAPRTAGVYLPGGPWAKPGLKPALGNLPPGEPVFSVFLTSEASRADLEQLGARLRTYVAGVWTAFVPYSNLRDVAASPLVTYTQLARPLWQDLSEAIVEAGVNTLNSTMALRGTGTLIGVADDAIDFHHLDFCITGKPRDPITSRILYFWDQDPDPADVGPLPVVPGSSSTFTIGIEYSKADLDADIAAAPPYSVVPHVADAAHGHGTVVLGCAAGNGNATTTGRIPMGGTPGPGAAPQADLLFVAMLGITGSDHVVDEGNACDAIAYIFARADALPGTPCVANLSYSSDLGPHDGCSSWDVALDGHLSTNGRAITLSAGNSQLAKPHKSAMVAQGATVDLELTYVSVGLVSDAIEIWFDGQDSISIEVLFTPNVVPPVPFLVVTPPVLPGNVGSGPAATTLPADVALLSGTTVEVHSQTHLQNGDRFISILLNAPAGGNLVQGTWIFRLNGVAIINGRVDAWVERNNRSYYSWGGRVPADDSTIVANPGSASLPITVGNYLKSDTFAVEPNSAHGKTRDDRYKPDLCAVGGLITAPRAYDRRAGLQDEYINGQNGTSCAAPITAGACALVFECRGNRLTGGQVQQILIDHADQSGIVCPSEDWGWGRLDASEICSGSMTKVDVWLRKDALDDGLEPFGREVFWESPDIEILNAAGTATVANPTNDPTVRYSNRVRVTVRNRSTATQTAYNTEVHLYWADPATNLPFPAAWNSSGIFTGGGNFSNASNVITIASLDPGTSQSVEFAWAPPAPGTNLLGDDHFCLLARIENPGDRAAIGVGGATVVAGSNNLAQRNVQVRAGALFSGLSTPHPSGFGGGGFDDGDRPTPERVVELPFYVRGRAGPLGLQKPHTFFKGACSLFVINCGVAGEIELELPVSLLPWHASELLLDGPRVRLRERALWSEYFATRTTDLSGAVVQRLTEVTGARRLRVESGMAILTLDLNAPRMTIPRLFVNSARVLVRLRVREPIVGVEVGYLRVGQSISGLPCGGVTLELRPPRL